MSRRSRSPRRSERRSRSPRRSRSRSRDSKRSDSRRSRDKKSDDLRHDDFSGSRVEVFSTFEEMKLKPDLLRGMYR